MQSLTADNIIMINQASPGNTIPLDDSAQRVKTTKHQNCSLWGGRNAQLARPI